MKTPILLFAVCVTLAVVPAMAQVVYSNGPTNGNTDAWTINFGFIVSDSFNLSMATTITGATFAMWLEPAAPVGPCAHCAYGGDTLETAELSITSLENGGTSYFDQMLNFTQSNCVANSYGYNICQENTSFNGPSLNAGTYWLNLQNAVTREGNPVYWDENSGPSLASQNMVGTIPSESFTLLGSFELKNSPDGSQQSSTPEPSSILMLGAGILSVASLFRLKIHR